MYKMISTCLLNLEKIHGGEGLIFCLLLSFFLEDLLNWEDENNPSNEFWKSIKGGFKEKVI